MWVSEEIIDKPDRPPQTRRVSGNFSLNLLSNGLAFISGWGDDGGKKNRTRRDDDVTHGNALTKHWARATQRKNYKQSSSLTASLRHFSAPSAAEMDNKEEEDNNPSSSMIACEEEDLEDRDYLFPQTKYDPDEIRPKEVILIVLALLLLVCSVLLFFKHWKKNYRDINQLPYYAYLYQKDPAEFADVPPPVVNAAAKVNKVGKSSSDLTLGLTAHIGSSQPNLVLNNTGVARFGVPPPLARMSTDPSGMRPTLGGGGRVRAPMLSSRATSDVSFRYNQRCRVDVMRRLKEQDGQNGNSFILNRRASEAAFASSSSTSSRPMKMMAANSTLKEEESPLEEMQQTRRSCDKIDENNEISSASISTDVWV